MGVAKLSLLQSRTSFFSSVSFEMSDMMLQDIHEASKKKYICT